MISTVDRFMKRVRKTPTCWLWQGYLDKEGYGKFKIAGRYYQAHRTAYYLFAGEIPDELTVDHTCFVTSCVNPDHLRLLTRSENSQLQRSALKTHCKNGHEYTPENTYVRRRGVGARDCRTCGRERTRRYLQRRRAA